MKSFQSDLVSYLSNQKANPCHAANTGQFCSTGGGGGFVEVDSDTLNAHYDLDNNCPPIDCGALKKYTQEGYDVVNNQLRHGDYSLSSYKRGWDAESVAELQRNLDKSFDSSPTTPKNMIAYRGVAAEAFSGLKPGDSFIDKGYVSTTLDKGEMRGGMKVEIRIPKGTKGIYIEKASYIGSEKEFLLNRGLKFKIIDIKSNINKFGNETGEVILEVG